jgi:hypothetical protein
MGALPCLQLCKVTQELVFLVADAALIEVLPDLGQFHLDGLAGDLQVHIL